jgi:UDP-N-acetylmuramyl pentapeptide phosphotransferase/UDP-N-acetylglucosamine-1-phosphate transferase
VNSVKVWLTGMASLLCFMLCGGLAWITWATTKEYGLLALTCGLAGAGFWTWNVVARRGGG